MGKSGGTSQFASYLLVSPRYELSIGISATKDTGIVPLEVASEIGAAFLKSEGADIVKTADAIRACKTKGNGWTILWKQRPVSGLFKGDGFRG